MRNFDYSKGIGELLTKFKYTIATAESCTAGGVANNIAQTPGASNYLKGGIISYRTEIKEQFLGVSKDTIEKYTVVSSQSALQMAFGVKKQFNTDIGVSITGVAGPGDAYGIIPSGTVYIGIVTDEISIVNKYNFDGDRSMVMFLAIEQCVRDIYYFLKDKAENNNGNNN